MTELYDGLIADLFQNTFKRNAEAQAISYAILQEKHRIMDEARRTRTMAEIDELPDAILDVLAVELRTPAYSEDLPIEIKRTMIKGTLSFFQKLGTPSAVNWVIRSIFGAGCISEWFTYGGDPYHFRVTGLSIEMARTGYAAFIRLLELVKRKSAVLDAVVMTSEHEQQLFAGVGVAVCKCVTVRCEHPAHSAIYLVDENGDTLADENGQRYIDEEE